MITSRALQLQARAGSSSRTEFDILKESHQFLREDANKNDASWDDQLAAKYYASLYREFAVCDLKHYKSGNFALRWRSEDEVLSGAGELTCGNIRCDFHNLPEHLQSRGPSLATLELPFAYEEHGEQKSALVKVVLCPKCLKKLMWKRRKEKEIAEGEGAKEVEQDVKEEEEEVDLHGFRRRNRSKERKDRKRTPEVKDSHHPREREARRRRNSRSRSPRDRRRHDPRRDSD